MAVCSWCEARCALCVQCTLYCMVIDYIYVWRLWIRTLCFSRWTIEHTSCHSIRMESSSSSAAFTIFVAMYRIVRFVFAVFRCCRCSDGIVSCSARKYSIQLSSSSLSHSETFVLETANLAQNEKNGREKRIISPILQTMEHSYELFDVSNYLLRNVKKLMPHFWHFRVETNRLFSQFCYPPKNCGSLEMSFDTFAIHICVCLWRAVVSHGMSRKMQTDLWLQRSTFVCHSALHLPINPRQSNRSRRVMEFVACTFVCLPFVFHYRVPVRNQKNLEPNTRDASRIRSRRTSEWQKRSFALSAMEELKR